MICVSSRVQRRVARRCVRPPGAGEVGNTDIPRPPRQRRQALMGRRVSRSPSVARAIDYLIVRLRLRRRDDHVSRRVARAAPPAPCALGLLRAIVTRSRNCSQLRQRCPWCLAAFACRVPEPRPSCLTCVFLCQPVIFMRLVHTRGSCRRGHCDVVSAPSPDRYPRP